MKSNGSWLDLVAESKRKSAMSLPNSKGSGYLDLLQKRVRYSRAASPGSKPTESKSAASPMPASSRPRIKHGG
jgi:hypothetical protein